MNESAPYRSRRAILAGAVAAIVAGVEGVLRPSAVTAANGDAVTAGQITTASATTKLDGTSNIEDGATFQATHSVGAAVLGESSSGAGVIGKSDSHWGVRGSSSSGIGVYGYSESSAGVYGMALAADQAAVQGYNAPGLAVLGSTDSGTALKGTATTGKALEVQGRAVFSRSGRVSVAAGRTYVDVTVPGVYVPVTAQCFASLNTYRAGVFVAAIRPAYPASTKIRIHFSKPMPAATWVSWIVFG